MTRHCPLYFRDHLLSQRVRALSLQGGEPPDQPCVPPGSQVRKEIVVYKLLYDWYNTYTVVRFECQMESSENCIILLRAGRQVMKIC